MTHVTLAAFLGGWEIILILAVLLFLLASVGAVVFLIAYLSRRTKGQNPPPRPAPGTQIVSRKCPQCGAELKPDVPEGLCPACLLQRGLGTEGGAPPGTPPFTPPPLSELAGLFPQLEILELIGKGGMGAVYKARQPALDRLVALKILAPRSGGDLDFAERFTREARALAKLSHPNIVGVYDFGQAGSLNYFIMEFVDGPNLRQIEQAGKLQPREALEIIPQICAALQFAHDEGVVHRDIKPENVLLDKKGRVKIADFGLAKILGQEPKDLRLTGARDVMGTPHYMAPEQIEKPQTVDHRADIYSLGVVFYEMLTGELPLGKFQPPSSCTHGMQIDARLDEVVLRSLEKEPERRYQQVSEVKTRVETIANSQGGPAAGAGVTPNPSPGRDYRTKQSFFGLPLAHVAWGVDPVTHRPRVAKGWIAIGSRAKGLAAVGIEAYGLIAVGLIAGGIFPTGLLAFGVWSVGLVAYGMVSTGLLAIALIHAVGLVSLANHSVGLVHFGIDVSVFFLLGLPIAAIWFLRVIGSTIKGTGPSAGQPAAATAPSTDRFWRFIIIVFVVIPTLGLLGSMAIQNFIKVRPPAVPTATNAPFAPAALESAADYGQTVAGLPPVVVETWPVSGARDVEPGVAGIRVRFSKEMADGGWSWSTAWEDSTPETVGQIHYEADRRTCVLKAKLEPGRTYAWWLNSGKFHNFTDPAGRPAVPYLLIFQTKQKTTSSSGKGWENTDTSQPRVISVSPADGAANVDETQAIRIRFDQPMNPHDLWLQWQSGGFLPEGQPHYEPERNEFVIPVRLFPGQTNALQVNWNDGRMGGFHGTNSTSAREYNWHFTTKARVTKPGAAKPNVVQISPTPGETLPVLTLLEITFDQPMTPPDQSPPYLRKAGRSFDLPVLIPCFDYAPTSHRFTVPVVLPPDNDTKLILEGFHSADGIVSDPVVIRCQIGTNSYARQQLDRIATAAQDSRLEQLLSLMKASRARLNSGIETVRHLSLYGQEKSFDQQIMSCSVTFKWQGTHQVYADITGPMMSTRAFILGSDGTTCWLYSENEHNEHRLDSSPAVLVPDIYTSIADPFALTKHPVKNVIAKERLIYEGQTQLAGRTCHRVASWIVRQPEDKYDRVDATRREWWIDAETFLPARVVVYAQYGGAIFSFHYEQLNQPLPDAAFQPPAGAKTDAKPLFFKQAPAPDEKRFLTIKDGGDGRMSGRLGWSGPGGTTSSGLN